MLGQVLLSCSPDSPPGSDIQPHFNCAPNPKDDTPPVLLLVVLDPLLLLSNGLGGQERLPMFDPLVEADRIGSLVHSRF